MKPIAVLFAREDSIYKSIPGCDVYDITRDARSYPGGRAVVCHPPCRAWGRLRWFAKPRADEKDLAHFAAAQVRRWGGVLEHPEASSLWAAAQLPRPGLSTDEYGGHSLSVSQSWWGHRAEKKTWLYVCGIDRRQVPAFPLSFDRGSHIVSSSLYRRGDPRWRPHLEKAEREKTPPAFAQWLVDLARLCTPEERRILAS